jgi:hypothetical protein
MRDFVVRDPDGHRFTLGCGEEALREWLTTTASIATGSPSIRHGSKLDRDRGRSGDWGDSLVRSRGRPCACTVITKDEGGKIGR